MKKILISILLLTVVLLSGCNSLYWKEHTATECVKEKWIKGVNDRSQKYLIGMESEEVYQITDSFFKWQFSSSDIYNKIDEDKCYDITYYGWRMGFFSTYRVIYEATEINQE